MLINPNQPLTSFIAQADPRLYAPHHLEPLPTLLDAATKAPQRVLCSLPIRHYKTSTAMHAVAKWLLVEPTLRIIFMTHSARYAQQRGREIRDLCQLLGVKIKTGHNTIQEWRTEEGGGVYVMSADQSALGQDVDILIVDDPHAGPEDADNADMRQIVDETIAFYTARLNRGGSVFLIMSRFHVDDPIGRRLRRTAQDWHYVHKRAIEDEGLPTEHALEPQVKTLEELKAIRAEMAEIDPTERTWWSQFQNEPRTQSGDLFKQPLRYSSLPEWPGFRDALGIDLAYSQSADADWFALAAIRIWSGVAYVRNIVRFQADVSKAAMHIRHAWAQFGRCPVYSYMAGPEKGAAQYLTSEGIPVQVMNARFNKRVRAQKTVDRWNAGKVMVPEHMPGLDAWLGRMTAFRGVDGDADDEIDALVSACDGALSSGVTGPRVLGVPRI